ncbi:translocation/assembly module TamB domain-containing protein [Oryzibacter oryziterrae]|uniref:translocation/assembly module TamB domain-containing protein n=1 Tax=Oryzibacter oryziterrae TaxID=2766474 RepID=UPI001F01E5DC|nr:translocation/assembly module TamB domain-containing protein [Oryzibacter oryziterrae]
MRKLIVGAFVAVLCLLGVVSVGPVLADDTVSAEKGAFLNWVEEKLSTPDRKIAISAIDGALSSDVTLPEITIADRQGVWLRILGAHLKWSRTALLTGTLSVDTLEADRLEVIRKPLPADTVTPAASEGFSVPELPVAVEIGKLRIGEVALSAPVMGEDALLTVEGALSLSGGSLTSNLAIERIDGQPAKLAVKANFDGGTKTLDLDFGLHEPKGGMLSGVLGIPERPALDLTVKGTGPLSDFSADVAFDSDSRRLLSGKTTISADGDGYRFASQMNGDLSPLVQPDYALYLAGDGHFDLDGRYGGDGRIAIDRLTLAAPVLSLDGSAQLAADGFPTALDLKGKLGKDGSFLPIGGASSTTGLGGARFALVFGQGGRWSLDLDADTLVTSAGKADRVTLRGGGVAEALDRAADRHVTFDLAGATQGLQPGDPDLAKAVGGEAAFKAAGNWSGGHPLVIDLAELSTPTAAARFSGEVTGGMISGKQQIEMADLRPASGLAGRPLSGALSLSTTGGLTPMTGAFDLVLDGKATDVTLGAAAADRLLAGVVSVAGRVRRDTGGVLFDGVTLGGEAFSLTLDGQQAKAVTDVTASAEIHNLNKMLDEASGPLAARVHLGGSGAPFDVTADLSSPGLRLRGHDLKPLKIAFDGQLDGAKLDGRLSGGGALDKVPLQVAASLGSGEDGSRSFSGLKLSAGKTRISGDVRLSPARLMDGQLAMDSPDIAALAPLALVEAHGAVKGTVGLTSVGGQQAAEVAVKASGLRVEGSSVGAATLSAEISDLFGAAAVTGKGTAEAVSSGGVKVASVEATAEGTLQATRFAVTLRGVSASQAVQAGLAPFTVAAKGQYANNTVDFQSLKVSGDPGLSVDAAGRVPLSGAGLDVKAKATIPLALGNRLLAVRGARVQGTATADILVSGSLADPRFGGSVQVADGSLVDPQSTNRLTGIALRLNLTPKAAVVDSFSAVLNGGGQVGLKGSIGLDPNAGLPVDLNVTFGKTKVTDGKIITATVGGDISIKGSVTGGLAVAGGIDVARAEITIPEGMGASANILDVKHRLPPPNVKRTLERIVAAAPKKGGSVSGSVGLNLEIRAPARLFVRGRGIDAELGGSLKVLGTLDNVQPIGSFNLIRGRVDVIGQRITFDRGSVTLTGDLDPSIDFSATTESDQISVTASVTGRASDPQIVLSSSPELPQDEILARFLFKRSMSELSPVQIGLLATAVAQLAGGGRDNGLLDRLRSSIGLDDLDVTTDKNGNAAVKAGRYITEKVYLGVTAGGNGQSGVAVNLDITNDLKAKAEATQAESKVGVYYEHEY